MFASCFGFVHGLRLGAPIGRLAFPGLAALLGFDGGKLVIAVDGEAFSRQRYTRPCPLMRPTLIGIRAGRGSARPHTSRPP